jgi:hypothetical protein
MLGIRVFFVFVLFFYHFPTEGRTGSKVCSYFHIMRFPVHYTKTRKIPTGKHFWNDIFLSVYVWKFYTSIFVEAHLNKHEYYVKKNTYLYQNNHFLIRLSIQNLLIQSGQCSKVYKPWDRHACKTWNSFSYFGEQFLKSNQRGSVIIWAKPFV